MDNVQNYDGCINDRIQNYFPLSTCQGVKMSGFSLSFVHIQYSHQTVYKFKVDTDMDNCNLKERDKYCA
jgi:hypothetical protein